MSRFEIGETDFLLDGEPFRVLSGAIHYFRVHPDQWRDRVRKARLMGLNTIETYVPWNLHEPTPGAWDESGGLDLAEFLRIIHSEGLRAIVRPGPYICAELSGGGLPAWLFADPDVGVRRHEPRFLAAIGGYFDRVLSIVAPAQIDRGGPVVLVQVENEYGAYGADADYLDAVTAMIRAAGIETPLTTVDQPRPEWLEQGSRPGLHRTASFGSRPPERLAALRAAQPTGPLMSSEYWNGWFDSWGLYHHRTSAAESAADLDALLATGASVNLYMFHGGTNFGLTNGANDRGVYQPIATSYDYDAPLSESGEPSEKYWAYREVIGRYAPLPDEIPEIQGPAPTGRVELSARQPFLASLDSEAPTPPSDQPPTFADIAPDAAFVISTARVTRDGASILLVGEVRDRVTVVVDGHVVGTLSRDSRERALTLPPIRTEIVLIAEDQGRVNYGPRLGEDKGLIGGVEIVGETAGAVEWTSQAVRETDLLARAAPRGTAAGPIPALTIASGTFVAEEARDRFLDTTSLGRGIAWVNGFCLGRYWSRGPQRTLYVPGPVLRVDGPNTLVVLELDTAPGGSVEFAAAPDLGAVED